MTSRCFLLIVTTLSFLGLTMRLEDALPSRYANPNPATWTSSRYLRAAPNQQTSAKEPKQTTVTGIVVALGARAVRADNRCRQLTVVRATARGNGNLKNKYLLVPRNFDCADGDFTNEMFQNKRKWRFPLIRGADCDRTFEQIKHMTFVHPQGVFSSVLWMKMVPGNDGEKIALTQKLLCYEIDGALKPVQ